MNNDFESAIATFLLTTRTELTAVIGQNLFPEEAFQGATYPIVTYKMTDDEQLHNVTGADNLCWNWFQFVIYANNARQRRQIQDILRNLLDGKLNTNLTYTGGSVILSSSWMTNGGQNGGQDHYESPPDASETGIFERRVTFRMCFQQTLPTL